MTPISSEEHRLFGADRAPSMVPMVIVDNKRAALNIDAAFQQIDIFPSITAKVTGNHCQSDWYGNFWSPSPQPAKYIIRRRGDRRDRISIFKGQAHFNLRMHGDKSTITGPQTPSANLSTSLATKEKRKLLEHIHYLRPR